MVLHQRVTLIQNYLILSYLISIIYSMFQFWDPKVICSATRASQLHCRSRVHLRIVIAPTVSLPGGLD